jgi:glycosyltransferase involved in cell wall biosynthesis
VSAEIAPGPDPAARAPRRVLVSAYGCEPLKGSEQGVGWNWVVEMARSNELWVITRANNRPGIERALPVELRERIHFVFYDPPSLVRRLKRGDRGLYLFYLAWQWGAYRVAKGLLLQRHFDLCQHLTFGSMWMPTFMHRLPIPFVWGPVGGGEGVPLAFARRLSIAAFLSQWVRTLAIRVAPLNPFFRGPARAASAIIARTEESAEAFPKSLRSKVRVMLETGVGEEVFGACAPARPGEAASLTELVYTGRLVSIKNVAMALRAVALARRTFPGLRLTIVGDGPDRRPLEELAKELGIVDAVRFQGAVPHEEVIRILQASHVFLFPSLKEGGTWSLMEAMAMGLPVVCLDGSGMRVITDEACAFRIRPTSPEETTLGMAEALLALARSPDRRRAMGEAGRQRIRDQFAWSRKGAFMEQLLGDLGLPPREP